MSRQVIYTAEQARDTRHRHFDADLHFQCVDCRQIKSVSASCGTGYALRPDGSLVCYQCCARVDRDDMVADGKAVMYFAQANGEITNWPGTLRFPVTAVRKFRHPFVSEAWLGEFRGPDGKLWRFKNIGDSQLAHCRRAGRQ